MKYSGNRSPIVILGIQGGGTGKLWDLIVSHPDCQTPGPELNEIFGPWPKRKVIQNLRREYLKRSHDHFRDKWQLFDIRDIQDNSQDIVVTKQDIKFFEQRISSLIESRSLNSEDMFKHEGHKYQKKDIDGLRPVFKALEGGISSVDFLLKAYPDLRVICLIRNGLAYAESKLRHKRAKDVLECSQVYNYVYRKFVQLSERNNVVLLRYEDYVKDPINELLRLYRFLNLDVSKVQKFKIQGRGYHGGVKNYGKKNIMTPKEWFILEELPKHFKTGINEKGIGLLEKSVKEEFLNRSGDAMRFFNYLEEN